VRLSENDAVIIKNTILKYAKDAKVILFGSRVHDDKKGGDIDIFVQTTQHITLREQIKILAEIEIAGITRKVDLLIQTPDTKKQNIFETALKEGIVL